MVGGCKTFMAVYKTGFWELASEKLKGALKYNCLAEKSYSTFHAVNQTAIIFNLFIAAIL